MHVAPLYQIISHNYYKYLDGIGNLAGIVQDGELRVLLLELR